MSWKKALIPLACVPLIILLAYGFHTDPKAIPSPLVQKMAPGFRIAIYDGDALSLEGLKGKPVVLNFWASWCYPACYEEAPLQFHVSQRPRPWQQNLHRLRCIRSPGDVLHRPAGTDRVQTCGSLDPRTDRGAGSGHPEGQVRWG
jgi:hypothetical protein